jgi:hypothetical protein
VDDTVTLALGGSVPLRGFATALDRLTKALTQLSTDAGARVDWVISGLDYSSAIATVAGRSLDEASEPLIPSIVRDFGGAGESLAYGRPTAVSKRALQFLQDIAGLIGDDGIDEVRFETADVEAVIRSGDAAAAPTRREPSRDRGTVVGRVQTLQARGHLRFTLYDLAHDRAVSCWLQPGQEELMRDAWGHLVEVEGLVSRDPLTNVPLSVRQVTDIRLFGEPSSSAWLSARGAARSSGEAPAEDVIRQLRDAW